MGITILKRLWTGKDAEIPITELLGGIEKPQTPKRFYDSERFGPINAYSLNDDRYKWGDLFQAYMDLTGSRQPLTQEEVKAAGDVIPMNRWIYYPNRNIRRLGPYSRSVLSLAGQFCVLGSGALSLLGSRGNRYAEDIEQFILSGRPLLIFCSPRIMVDAYTKRNPTLDQVFHVFGRALAKGANLFFLMGMQRLALHCRITEDLVVFEGKHAEYTTIRDEHRVRSVEMSRAMIHSLTDLQTNQNFFRRIANYEQLEATAREFGGGFLSEPEIFMRTHFADRFQMGVPEQDSGPTYDLDTNWDQELLDASQIRQIPVN
ncbi:MAG: hypothetical protein HQM03_19060 [Magnetococcales bacterium]|nr:hypothetical protein [Magnetococcales bacterium]